MIISQFAKCIYRTGWLVDAISVGAHLACKARGALTPCLGAFSWLIRWYAHDDNESCVQMALVREEDMVGSTAVITANVTDEHLERSRRTQASGRGIFFSSLETDDNERAKIFE